MKRICSGVQQTRIALPNAEEAITVDFLPHPTKEGFFTADLEEDVANHLHMIGGLFSLEDIPPESDTTDDDDVKGKGKGKTKVKKSKNRHTLSKEEETTETTETTTEGEEEGEEVLDPELDPELNPDGEQDPNALPFAREGDV